MFSFCFIFGKVPKTPPRPPIHPPIIAGRNAMYCITVGVPVNACSGLPRLHCLVRDKLSTVLRSGMCRLTSQ